VSTIESRLTSRTKAIVPVHIGGQTCDMEPILELARARGLAVVEDAAHALPASYRAPGRNDRRRDRVQLLRHEDDHHRRGRHGHDRARRLCGSYEADEPPRPEW
jgi:hypothetical protein